MLGDGDETPGLCESEQGFKMLLWTLEHTNHDLFWFYSDAPQISTRVILCSDTGPSPTKNMRFCVILNIPLHFSPWNSDLMNFDPQVSWLGWSILPNSNQEAVFWIFCQRKYHIFKREVNRNGHPMLLWEKWRGHQTYHHIVGANYFTVRKL